MVKDSPTNRYLFLVLVLIATMYLLHVGNLSLSGITGAVVAEITDIEIILDIDTELNIGPAISDVQAIANETNATITWTTDIPGDSELEYGTGSYSERTPIDSSLTTTHTVSIANLQPGTTYHYRVISAGEDQFLQMSTDAIFTTTASTTVKTTSTRLKTSGSGKGRKG
jgi:hypothetical protein